MSLSLICRSLVNTPLQPHTYTYNVCECVSSECVHVPSRVWRGMVDGLDAGQTAAMGARPQAVLHQAQGRQAGGEHQLVVLAAHSSA